MERATFIGLIAGTILWIAGAWIGSRDLSIYWDIAAIFITVGGSFCSVLVATPLKRVGMLRTLFSLAFQDKKLDLIPVINTLGDLAELARRNGVLSLEEKLSDIQDSFLRRSVQLVVDGSDPEMVKTVLYAEIDQMENRHAMAKKVLEDWGFYAPAWGMIGTLVGLIAMLRNLSDVASIGRNMATALITTLYGAVMANLIFLPMAAKLDLWNKYEVIEKEVVIEGVLSIQAGENPTLLREKLYSFLPPVDRPKSASGRRNTSPVINTEYAE